jgi:hypothetical protein
VRHWDGVEPPHILGRWPLVVAFAVGVATTALIHSWLWPSHLKSPTAFEPKAEDHATANRLLVTGPPVAFYEVKVPWNPAPHAPKRTGMASRSIRSSALRSRATTSKAPQPQVRDALSPELDASIKPASGKHTSLSELSVPTQSSAVDAAAPAIFGENPPAVNFALDHGPIALNLDLPDRGPNPLPHSSGTAKSETIIHTYEGTILDAACNARSEPCGISATTTRFALRLKEGQILPFDSVGNLRAETAKKKSRWVSKSLAGKEIRAKVGGMIVGNELIAVSID